MVQIGYITRMDNVIHPAKWYKELIQIYRNKILEIPLEIRESVSNLSDFSEKIEIFDFWMVQNHKDSHFIIVDKGRDIIDSSINIIGPYDVNEDEHVEELDRSLEKYDEIFQKRGKNDFRDYLIQNLLTVMSNARGSKEPDLLHPHSSGVFQKVKKDGSFTWYWRGNIFKSKPSDLVQRIFFQAAEHLRFKETMKSNKAQIMSPGFTMKSGKTMEISSPDGLISIGGYFKPDIWIGDLPTIKLSDILRNRSISSLIQQMYKVELESYIIYLNSEGFVRVLSKENDQNQTLSEDSIQFLNMKKIVNSIFSLFILNDIILTPFSRGQLQYYLSNISTPHIVGMTIGQIPFEEKINHPFDNDPLDVKVKRRKQIEFELVNKIFNTLTKIQNTNAIDFLDLFTQSYVHLIHKEFTQSFIFSWTIIDKHLKTKWMEFLNNTTITSTRKSKLSNDINNYIRNEFMEINSVIDTHTYRVIDKLRKIRNKFLHDEFTIEGKQR